MGGHRRDQSDSHMPLRQSEIQGSFDAQELQVQVGPTCNGSLSQTLPQYIDPCDPTPRNGRSHEVSDIKDTLDAGFPSRTCAWNCTRRLSPSSALWCRLFSSRSFSLTVTPANTTFSFFLLTVIHDIVPEKSLPDLVFIVIGSQQRWAWAVGDVLSTVKYVDS